MYEQFLFPQKHPIKNVLFLLGILLLPFAFLDFTVKNGVFSFSWEFNIIELAASVCLSLTYFLPTSNRMHLLNLPYIAVLVLEFLQFGSVSLLGNEIPFVDYIASAYLMLGSVFVVFCFYFIAEGKMRTRVPLILWSSVIIVFATVSLIVGIPPFGVYTEITKGIFVRNLSDYIQFVLFYSSPILLSCALQSDHFPKKKRKRRAKKEKE